MPRAKQSEKTKEERGKGGGVEEQSGVCMPGVTGTREFLISFHCDTSRKLLLLFSPGVYGSYSGTVPFVAV